MSHPTHHHVDQRESFFGDPGEPFHPLDAGRADRVVDGLVGPAAHWEHAGSFRAIELVGRFLTGDWEPPSEPAAREQALLAARGSGGWEGFLGRIGALALRAVAPLTSAEHRARLLRFLRMWAESPFADGAPAVRLGYVNTQRDYARDERGAVFALTVLPREKRRFVEVRTGEANPPRLGPVRELAEVPRGWGSPDQLRRLVAHAEEHGPLPWDPEAVTALAEGTGMGRAAAALVLSGVPGSRFAARHAVDAEQRALLRMGVAEVEDGLLELRGLAASERLDLLADVLPEDPATLWEPSGPRVLAERIAEAWRERYGRRFSAAPRTWATFVGASGSFPAAELCAALATPGDTELLTEDVDSELTLGDYGIKLDGRDLRQWRFERFLGVLPRLVRLAYDHLPAGDPVRDGVPAAVALLRARLSHPMLLLDPGTIPDSRRNTLADLRERFGDAPSPLAHRLGVEAVDDGLTIAVPGSVYPDLFFRPAHYGDDDRSRLLSESVSYHDHELRVVEWLRGEDCADIVARMRPGTLPAGAFEADPQASAPDLVARVAERFSLPADAAAYYLQLLTLPHPTDRNVREWNGWRPARLRKAAAALVAAGLAVEDRRARAGRKVFLPGPWATATRHTTAMEVWKAELLGCELSADRRQVTGAPPTRGTLPGWFAAAWKRVDDGDGPR